MTQNERYHARRARGQCALCPRRVDAAKDGAQPWHCRKCRIKLASYARDKRARRRGHTMITVMEDGRWLNLTGMPIDAAAEKVRRAGGEIKMTLHIVKPEVAGARSEDQ